MEKMMVIAGIWAICAFAAVLFIRGATAPTRERGAVRVAGSGDLNESDAMRRAD